MCLVALGNSDVLGLFEEEGDEHKVDAEEDNAPPPHPAPSLAVDDVAGRHGAQGASCRLRKQKPSIHGGMLMYEEDVGNGDLCYHLTDCAAKPGEKIAADKVTAGAGCAEPDASYELKDGADNVERSAAIFVYQGDEEDTTSRESDVIVGCSGVEEVDGKVQLMLISVPSCAAEVELHKGQEDVDVDKGEVENFTECAPVEGVVGVSGRYGV